MEPEHAVAAGESWATDVQESSPEADYRQATGSDPGMGDAQCVELAFQVAGTAFGEGQYSVAWLAWRLEAEDIGVWTRCALAGMVSSSAVGNMSEKFVTQGASQSVVLRS